MRRAIPNTSVFIETRFVSSGVYSHIFLASTFLLNFSTHTGATLFGVSLALEDFRDKEGRKLKTLK